MPLDMNDMLLKLSPLSGLGGGAQRQDSSMERKRLQLMREQFENQKQQQAESNRLHLLAEQGEMARARMASERQKAKAEATMAAQLQKDKLAAYAEFTKLNGEGNIEGARAMVPMMSALGMGVNLEGEAEGLPRYRIDMDAQAAAGEQAKQALQASPRGPNESALQSLNRLSVLGLDDATGNLDDTSVARRATSTDGAQQFTPELSRDAAVEDALTPGEGDAQATGDVSVASGGLMPASLSSGDAYAQALAAGQSAKDAMGLPAQGRGAEDFTGAVPSNVIDLGATQAATLRRLDPVMSGLAEAYPDAVTQEGARGISAGLRGSGLPLAKQLEAFDKGISGPAAQRNAQIGADAQADKFRETRDELTPVQEEELKSKGYSRADGNYKNAKVAESVSTLEAGKTVTGLLTGDKRNHQKAVNYLMTMTGNKGAQTEADALRVIGKGRLSTIDELKEWIHDRAATGFSPEEVNSILEFVDMQSERNRGVVFGYLDKQHEQMDNPKTHERVRAGYEEFINGGSVPPELLDEYEELRKAEQAEDAKSGKAAPRGRADPAPLGTGGLGDMSDFDLELEAQALEADLDPEAMRAVMGPESGGRPDARNAASGATGIGQFLPSVAKALGTSTDELAKMSATEQLPFLIQYYKGHGLGADSPPEDYVMATAAPAFIGKSADTVVYPKGSKAWEQNAPWRPKDGGDITVGSILAFYKPRGGSAAANAAPEPKTELDRAVKEALGL
jgi:hypothetical protein